MFNEYKLLYPNDLSLLSVIRFKTWNEASHLLLKNAHSSVHRPGTISRGRKRLIDRPEIKEVDRIVIEASTISNTSIVPVRRRPRSDKSVWLAWQQLFSVDRSRRTSAQIEYLDVLFVTTVCATFLEERCCRRPRLWFTKDIIAMREAGFDGHSPVDTRFLLLIFLICFVYVTLDFVPVIFS